MKTYPSAIQQWQNGFNAYHAGKKVSEMTTPSMVAGWWAAATRKHA